MKKIIVTESQLKRVLNKVIEEQTVLSEQDINAESNMAVQCFLNKKGVKDDAGQPLKVDGSIGRLPNSKSAQAIAKYQSMIQVEADGVWGYNTMSKMQEKYPKDLALYKQCVSDTGGIVDKIFHFFGLD